MIKLLACVATLSLATIGISANASPVLVPSDLPSQSGGVSVNSNNPSNTVNDPSSAALQGASASLSIAPFVSLQAQVHDAPGIATQDAFAALDYYFAAVGGNPNDPVHVLVATTLLAVVDAYPNYAFAEIQVGGSGGVGTIVCSDGSCVAGQFSDTLALTVVSGQAVQVHLFIGAEEGFSTGGDAFASADPYIFVDPSFAGANNYSIIVSDGVGNAPATTPLPAAFPLFATGLGTLGLLGWRRKRKNSLAV